MADTYFHMLLFLLLYAFLGWAGEVCWYSVRNRHFVNRGFLSLPFTMHYGITFVILLRVLPTLGQGHVIVKFIITLTVFSVVRNLTGTFTRRVSHVARWEAQNNAGVPETALGWTATVGISLCILGFYYIIHPILAAAVLMLPQLPVRILVAVLAVLVVLDFFSTLYAVHHTDAKNESQRRARGRVQHLADGITDHIWRRLRRAYPGIETEKDESRYVFARGICLDKLVWVFLISALAGDIMETLYCGLVDGQWMNRSSVLYGPFSFVWGLGAVLLTVTLNRFAQKADRWIFLGGFVIGGVYEYTCSVFTELVFGTIFWDYSKWPLNIGGRTNILFCFFWGLLGMVWVKIIYPRMERLIEKMPAVAGKVLTWVVVFTMACNGILTAAALLRYNSRAQRPEPSGFVEQFLDENYDDAYIERHWPNMKVV